MKADSMKLFMGSVKRTDLHEPANDQKLNKHKVLCLPIKGVKGESGHCKGS